MKDTAVYIHIPFCDHKCIYCDFYSIISYDNTSTYLASLLNEIDYFSAQYKYDRKIISIFFGGGTPSFMAPDYIKKIIDQIKSKFNVDRNAEITLETNPGTVDKNKLIDFKNAGINRISIGVQSFDEKELKFLTRIHDSQTAIQTVNDASEAGFKNISIDLIFNLPKQTKEKWIQNLATAIKLPVTHISAYSLILEKGTILNKMVLDGKVTMQNEDYDAELYELTIDFFVKHGFNQYEVSNFCRPGFECKHNNAYWQYMDYLGLGTSAHSFVNGKRWWNLSSVKFYNAAVEKNGNAVSGSEILDENQKVNEYVMLALRSNGLNLLEFNRRFKNFWFDTNEKYLNQLGKEGFLILEKDFIRFTKKGYAVCDEILTHLK